MVAGAWEGAETEVVHLAVAAAGMAAAWMVPAVASEVGEVEMTVVVAQTAVVKVVEARAREVRGAQVPRAAAETVATHNEPSVRSPHNPCRAHSSSSPSRGCRRRSCRLQHSSAGLGTHWSIDSRAATVAESEVAKVATRSAATGYSLRSPSQAHNGRSLIQAHRRRRCRPRQTVNRCTRWSMRSPVRAAGLPAVAAVIVVAMAVTVANLVAAEGELVEAAL